MKKIILILSLTLISTIVFGRSCFLSPRDTLPTNNQGATDCCIPRKVNITFDTIPGHTATAYNTSNSTSKSLLEFGAIGDGVFDNTTAITNAIAWSSQNAEPVIVPKGVFITDVVTLKNCVHFIGVNRDSSIIRKKSGNSCILFNAVNTPAVSNIKFESLTIDGGNRYLNHYFNPTSPVKDSEGSMFMALNANNMYFTDVYLTGANNVMLLYNNSGIYMDKCRVDQIGIAILETTYSQNVKNVHLTRNRFLEFGCLDTKDSVYPDQYRFGADALSAGGSDWYIEDNYFFNGANTKWAWMEGRFTRNLTVRNNLFDGNGRNCFGFSIGPADATISNGPQLENAHFENNIYQNITGEFGNTDEYVNGRAKYEFPNYFELYGIKNMIISGNIIPNATFEFSYMTNVVFEKNEITNTMGGNSVIRIGGSGQDAGTNDIVDSIKIINNRIAAPSAYLIDFNPRTYSISNVTISGNTLTDYYNNYILLSKLAIDTTKRLVNINILNNNYIGNGLHIYKLDASAANGLRIEGNNSIPLGLTKENSFTTQPTAYLADNTILTQNNSYADADDVPPNFLLDKYVVGQTLTGMIDGVNKVFTLPAIPATGKATILLNGQLQLRGTNYTISGNTLTFINAPSSGDTLTTAYLNL